MNTSKAEGYASVRGSAENTTGDMIGASPAMKAIRAELESAARSDAKVLLTGESGVGKDLAAQLIHQRSARSHMPSARSIAGRWRVSSACGLLVSSPRM